MGWVRWVLALAVGLTLAAPAEATCRFYRDTDQDGRGVFSDWQDFAGLCTDRHTGWSATPGDCNDGDPTVYTSAPELCDAKDNDCDGTVDDGLPRQWYYPDRDGDGHGGREGSAGVYQCPAPSGFAARPAGSDCNDWDATTYPTAPELCDGKDNDCDTFLDDGLVRRAAWPDADADGYGDPGGATLTVCAAPSGYSLLGGDCVDADPAVHPGAADLCNDEDDDCDQDVDEDAWTVELWPDLDQDTYPNPVGAVSTCHDLPGYVAFEFGPEAFDCDDTDAAVHPGAFEVCLDGADNDCDGGVDNRVDVYFRDADYDGWGDAFKEALTFSACEESPPGVGWGPPQDCHDADPSVYPGAYEHCDGRDNDCDGTSDDGDLHYVDADRDGWGDLLGASVWVASCGDGAAGYARPGDCLDSDPFTYPGAAETCADGVDNNCDGFVDLLYVDMFPDADGDGYPNPSRPGRSWNLCSQDPLPGGWALPALGADCDDLDVAVHPGAGETCDGRDEDCDGEIDDGWLQDEVWPDADGDGYGALDATPVLACTPPFGWSRDGGDCEDDDVAVHPGAFDDCDGGDENCDGLVDEDVDLIAPWFPDEDGDGFGAASPVVLVGACASPPDGWVPDEGDCDDEEPAAHPGGAEVCDGIDNDCNGVLDDDQFVSVFWPDGDGDGYGDGDAAPVQGCEPPAGWSAEVGDCDDTDAGVHPGAFDDCDGGDENCDGQEDFDAALTTDTRPDADGDGFGDPRILVTRGHCDKLPAGWVVDGEPDCADDDPASNPRAVDVCDGLDNDCDGVRDEGWVWRQFWADVDGDGFATDAAAELWACAAPPGYASERGDCDDRAATVNPEAFDDCDGGDENCDGAADWDEALRVTRYLDQDRDGFGRSDVFVRTSHCDPGPTGYSTEPGDCDDSRPEARPGGLEACNGLDDDCDGDVDEGWGRGEYFPDDDGDGFGADDPGRVVRACAAPPFMVSDPRDCDDTDILVHPEAYDDCDGGDENCDGTADWDLRRVSHWHEDVDGDGWGNDDFFVQRGHCDDTAGLVQAGADCDDGDAAVHPGVVEVCNGVDDNCDALVDEGLPDSDGDGVCDEAEPCAVTGDEDGDGVCDDVDACWGEDATGDADQDGLCDSEDFMLNVGRVTVGAALPLQAYHVPPGARVHFFVSLRGPGAGPCHPGSGVCLGIERATLVAQAYAGPEGLARAQVRLPTSLPIQPGDVTWWQALWVDDGAADTTQIERAVVR